MYGLLLVTLKALVMIVVLLSLFAGVMLVERKVLAWFQYRKGPNRTGPWGLFQPIADAVKMMIKEDIIPRDADPIVFKLAPVVALSVALIAFAVIPIAPGWQVADVSAGMLTLMAITSLGVYGVALGGWASQSKYALLGSLRSTAQMISYELAMGMSALSVFVVAGSVRFEDIVASQAGYVNWNIFRMPVVFVIFLIAMFAETNRTPFDLPEAEAELVAGYHTEYSGMRMALFVMAEYVHMFTAAALLALLFLGGWEGPGPAFLQPVWFLLKWSFWIFFFMWVRATVPRLRYDRLMQLGWKFMLPVAAANLVLYAVAVVLQVPYLGGGAR